MILPSVVTGNLSPYPTVVMVTKAHQMASSAVLMLLSGAVSTFRMAMDEKMTSNTEMTATAENVPRFLF